LANRGDPYVKDPFWTPSKDYGIKYFYIFDGILWFSVYNFNLPGWTVWNLGIYNVHLYQNKTPF